MNNSWTRQIRRKNQSKHCHCSYINNRPAIWHIKNVSGVC